MAPVNVEKPLWVYNIEESEWNWNPSILYSVTHLTSKRSISAWVDRKQKTKNRVWTELSLFYQLKLDNRKCRTSTSSYLNILVPQYLWCPLFPDKDTLQQTFWSSRAKEAHKYLGQRNEIEYVKYSKSTTEKKKMMLF